MKKAIVSLLIIATILGLASCGAGRPAVPTRELMPWESDSGDELRLFIKRIEANGGDPLNNKDAGLQLPYDFSDIDGKNGRYAELPYMVFLMKQPGENRFTGSRFCVPGFVYSYWYDEDTLEEEIGFVQLSIIYYEYDPGYNGDIWEYGEFVDLLLVPGDDAQELYDELDSHGSVLVYFTYMGYSESYDMPVGYYEYHEAL